MITIVKTCDAISLYSMNWLLIGKFPYPPYKTVLQQLKVVTDGAPPRLPEDITFSEDFKHFVARW